MCRFTAEGCHPGSPIKQCWFITILLYFSTGTITGNTLPHIMGKFTVEGSTGTTAMTCYIYCWYHCYKDCNCYFCDHFYCWYNYWFHCDHTWASSQLRDAKVGMPSGHYHPMCNHRARESQLLVTCQSLWPVAMLSLLEGAVHSLKDHSLG